MQEELQPLQLGHRYEDDDKEAVQSAAIIGSHLPLETGQRK